MYHNVQPNTPDGNFVSPENFESVLQALQSSEIYTVSSDEASKVLSTNTKPAQKLIWLTFDDGTQNFYDYVFPLLKKYNMHATSFIITNNVVNNVPGFMTAAEIKEIASTGLVDFQSHTVNHADLSVASDNRQTAELRDSKAYLDSLLNQKTHVICYPSGSHNPNTSVIASGLGYDLGLLDPGRTYDGLTAKNVAAKTSDGLFTLNRYRTFTNTTGKVVIDMISADEAYNVLNTLN
nr:polysaccharide deacetylase family protein [Lactovum miscens]